MKRTMLGVIVIVAGLLAGAGAASASPQGSDTSGSIDVTHARFEGQWIDLSKGWGAATACMIFPHRPIECFRTTEALLAHRATLPSPDTSCSSPLRLHDKANQLGTTIFVYTRGLWINLSTVDFDNMTSSYIVGACAVDLAALANGGGSHYPECLSAWCQEDVLLTGWDNVFSSVYLH